MTQLLKDSSLLKLANKISPDTFSKNQPGNLERSLKNLLRRYRVLKLSVNSVNQESTKDTRVNVRREQENKLKKKKMINLRSEERDCYITVFIASLDISTNKDLTIYLLYFFWNIQL